MVHKKKWPPSCHREPESLKSPKNIEDDVISCACAVHWLGMRSSWGLRMTHLFGVKLQPVLLMWSVRGCSLHGLVFVMCLRYVFSLQVSALLKQSIKQRKNCNKNSKQRNCRLHDGVAIVGVTGAVVAVGSAG